MDLGTKGGTIVNSLVIAVDLQYTFWYCTSSCTGKRSVSLLMHISRLNSYLVSFRRLHVYWELLIS